MVLQLLETTQTWLEQAVVGAVLSSPDHIRLTDEELGDVFDYMKLEDLMDSRDWQNSLYELYTASAAYAGYGKGLCRTYTDAYECEREDFAFSPQRVLHIDLNSESFSGTIKTLQIVRDGSVTASFMDTDLGMRGDNNEQYWSIVSNRVRELVRSLSNRVYMPHVTELLLTGPSATDRRFHAAVRAALHDHVSDEQVLAILEERDTAAEEQEEEGWQPLFSFATARGAADMAKRRQEGPNNCAQSDECRRRRDHVHDGDRQSTLLSQQPDAVRVNVE